MIRKAIYLTALATFLFLGNPAALAKNVDLVTLPDREGVQLTIYNSADITLVKETRQISLKKGLNQLQFSWSGTLIDPTSVEFRPLEHASDIEVADTVFPGQKPQHLIWNIESEYEGQVKSEVTYFTSGLTWQMDYVSITDPEEEKMSFDGYVRVYNNSGEEYENAEIRLIVGNINLVERIADLARRQGIPMPQPATPAWEGMRRSATRDSFDRAKSKRAEKEKAVVKEGLSEYFMFSIEGSETIKNGWSKRMRAVKAEDVAFKIIYRMRGHQYGNRPVRFFIWTNDVEHKLGDSPLPDGRVRIFRDNGKDGLAFVTEESIRYVPVKADIEINTGTDDLVVYETRKMSTKRYNFRFDQYNRVNGWDDEQDWVDTVKNYRTKPISFELRRVWDGDVDYESETATTLFDYRTAQVALSIGARAEKDYPANVVRHWGVNQKQNRVNLKK